MTSPALPAATPTLVSAAGNRDFINIQNNDASDIYAKFDGDSGTLTAALGWVIPANGGTLFISNDGNRNVYNKDVYLLSVGGVAAGVVKIQGA